MTLSKFWRILTCGRKKHPDAEPESTPQAVAGNDNRDDEPYSALSEVAAPGPVERETEEQERQHESLDRNIEESSHPHLANN